MSKLKSFIVSVSNLHSSSQENLNTKQQVFKSNFIISSCVRPVQKWKQKKDAHTLIDSCICVSYLLKQRSALKFQNKNNNKIEKQKPQQQSKQSRGSRCCTDCCNVQTIVWWQFLFTRHKKATVHGVVEVENPIYTYHNKRHKINKYQKQNKIT